MISFWKKFSFALRHLRSTLILLQHDLRIKFTRLSPPKPAKCQPSFDGVYFSCGNHFSYLLVSVKSLMRVAGPRVRRLHFYIDRRDPLSSEQKRQLMAQVPANSRLCSTRHAMSWGGTRLLDNELSAFAEIYAQLPSNGMLAKIDSDTLFLSGDIFEEVAQLDTDMAGQRYRSVQSGEYFQGGFYFLKSKAIATLIRRPILDAALRAALLSQRVLPELPEDYFMYSLAKENGLRITLLDYLFVDDELNEGVTPEKARALLSRVTSRTQSVIHFEKNKDSLLPWSEALGKLLPISV